MLHVLTSCRIVRASWLATFVVSISCAHASAAGEKLSFFRYSIESESLSDWQPVSVADAASTSQILGLFAGKSDAKMKLMAFRKSDDGGKVCAAERSAMNIEKTKYEKITAPRGWDCVYEIKDKSRVTAIKTFYIKGKSRTTDFSLVIVGESMPKERFLKAVNALKDVKR